MFRPTHKDIKINTFNSIYPHGIIRNNLINCTQS